MISEYINNRLSDIVYHVDSIKENRNVIYEGYDILDKQYRVLKIEDNQSNGMQAMAVVPMVNGEVDTSHIIIVYARTNFEKQKVIANDS